jgi:iron complex outermembrane receptor protein
MVEKKLSRSVRLLFAGSLVVGVGALVQPAFAQDAGMQRVEITGSSIKRIAIEGALPVQTLSKAQIEQTGATTAADLVAGLPSMQGFLTSSASVNGGGAGVQSASIHDIGTAYTLVLLNGRRIAPYSSGAAVNLASIPLSAVERVEILTDGASALYGSDAIAGVVNFILKKNQQDANIEVTYNRPTAGKPGTTSNVAISKGFGSLDKDGFNVLLAYSHDEQTRLEAQDREFSKNGGLVKFTEGNNKYGEYILSGNSIPGNVSVKTAAGSTNINPYYVLNGNCPATNSIYVAPRCLFNYAATVQALPELKRDGFFGSANFKINEDTTFFAEALYSKFTSTAAYAPPAQPLGIDLNSALYKNSVLPAIVKAGMDPTKVTSATMSLRLVDAGQRTDAYNTEAKHVAFGVDGNFKGFGYNVSYTHSENTQKDSAVAGYVSGNGFDALIKANVWNPFVPPSTATAAALAPAVLHQLLDTTTSKIDVLGVRGQADLFKAAGGTAQLGTGLDISKQSYIDNPEPILQGTTDTIVGGGTGNLPYNVSRKSYGGFAELVVPVIKDLEVTFSARYDSFDAVKNSANFNSSGVRQADADQGNSESSATYKLAAAWRPTDYLLLRGAYGTGFKAPSLLNVSQPLVNGGSSGFHNCPITSGPLLPLCNGFAEYTLMTGGNPLSGDAGLKPERSVQSTFGFRVEPSKSLTMGFDWWDVKIKDQIKTLPENVVFDNPKTYAALFGSYYDPIVKQNVLVAALSPFNIGQSHYQGIDWDHTFTTPTVIGKMSLNWTGTYMLKADIDVPGGPTERSVGRFNAYNDVTFRLIQKMVATWNQSAMFKHSLTMNYHSSYHDETITADNQGTVRAINADGSYGAYVDLARDVHAYTTFDWQTKVNFNKNFTLTGGVKNLFNQDPPFSQREAGGGNQSGYDGRYTDPLGRQLYVVGNYKF